MIATQFINVTSRDQLQTRPGSTEIKDLRPREGGWTTFISATPGRVNDQINGSHPGRCWRDRKVLTRPAPSSAGRADPSQRMMRSCCSDLKNGTKPYADWRSDRETDKLVLSFGWCLVKCLPKLGPETVTAGSDLKTAA